MRYLHNERSQSSRPTLSPQLVQIGHVPLEVFDGVGVIVDLAVFQKTFELEAGEAEQPGSLVVR